MAVKMNLWSLTLLPGETYPIYVQRDFVITNAALGEELRSSDGRSVIKVTHHPLPEDFFDPESDSELDDEESEYELDDEEGFKSTPKKATENGIANGVHADDEDMDDEEEVDDEDEAEVDKEDADEDDEDEEEEEEEEDSDYSDDGLLETSVICALTAGKTEQATLNLTFPQGDAIMFEVTGENSVHLMGNYIIQPEPYDSDDDSDFYSGEDDYSELYGDEMDDEFSELDDEEGPSAKITELHDTPAKSKDAKPVKTSQTDSKVPAVKADADSKDSKKRKADAVESPAPKPAASSSAAAAESTGELTRNQKKKLAKKAKLDAKKEGGEPSGSAPSAASNGPQKKTLPSGLIIEDVKVGDGPTAKTGKKLQMRYVGRLENGKQFDANTAGAPFSFVLGKGEVIKGWDEGLASMKVGGERKLTIPPSLAYGSQKIPGIPKNSTLKFEVKLLSIV